MTPDVVYFMVLGVRAALFLPVGKAMSMRRTSSSPIFHHN